VEILVFDSKFFTCKIEIYYITFLISLCVLSMHLESEWRQSNNNVNIWFGLDENFSVSSHDACASARGRESAIGKLEAGQRQMYCVGVKDRGW